MKFVADRLTCASPLQLAGQSPFSGKISGKIAQFTCPLDDAHSKWCPVGCDCYVRTDDRTVIFNCSDANLTAVPALPDKKLLDGIQVYELHIENNHITSLPHHMTGYQDVNLLFARNNSIDIVRSYLLPSNLSVLDVSHNELKHLDLHVLQHLKEMHTLISLHANPWVCDCDAYDLQRFVEKNGHRIMFADDIMCANGKHLMDDDNLCFWYNVYSALAIVAIICLIVVAVFLYLHTPYQLEILMYLEGIRKRFLRPFAINKSSNLHEFDAFIVHSTQDIDFVRDHLMEALEHGERPLKLRLVSRDVKAGELLHSMVGFNSHIHM